MYRVGQRTGPFLKVNDDMQWFNVQLKLTGSQLSLAHNAKVKTDMPEKNEKHLESVESVQWVER